MADRISDPTDAERSWIAGNIGVAEAIASAFGLEDRPLDPVALDTMWQRWMSGETLGIDDPNPFISALGIAFGAYLVRRTGLEWMVIEDEHGTEMALHAEKGDVRLFPANLVAKRFERREGPFFAALALQLEQKIAEIRE